MEKGDVVLVTGASTGIGRATAIRLAAAGFVTYAAMRGPLDRSEAKDLLEGGCRVVELDVTSADSCRACVDAVCREAGRVDALINNAGVNKNPSPVEDYEDDAHRSIMEANYFGAARLIRLVLPDMRSRRKGAIINVTSMAAIFWSPMLGPYNASKAALDALSATLAQEVTRFGVRVCSVRPGVIVTPFLQKTDNPPAGDAGKIKKQSAYKDRLREVNKFFTSQAMTLMQPADLVAEKMASLLTGPGEWNAAYDVGKDAEALSRTYRERGLDWYVKESSKPHSDAEFIAFQRDMGIDVSAAYGKAKL